MYGVGGGGLFNVEEDFLAEFPTKWDSKISLALGPVMTGEAVPIKQDQG